MKNTVLLPARTIIIKIKESIIFLSEAIMSNPTKSSANAESDASGKKSSLRTRIEGYILKIPNFLLPSAFTSVKVFFYQSRTKH